MFIRDAGARSFLIDSQDNSYLKKIRNESKNGPLINGNRKHKIKQKTDKYAGLRKVQSAMKIINTKKKNSRKKMAYEMTYKVQNQAKSLMRDSVCNENNLKDLGNENVLLFVFI